jgi:dTDP-4-dehydrorhamnose reductase
MGSRILLTGADGYVGGHLRRLAPEAVALGRDAGDVTELGDRIRADRPDAVIHLAAMARIGDCAADPAEARRVNVEGTRAVARAAREVGARLVHASTDQVFDGTGAPYDEDAAPSPLGPYAATKAESERVALEEAGDAAVARLHLIVGAAVPPRRSGTDGLLDGVRRGDRPTLFVDEFRSPIHVVDVGHALLALATGTTRGIVHVGGPERLSRLELGRVLLASAGLDPDLAREGSIADYDGPPRAPDTSFSPSRAPEILTAGIRFVARALREEGG